MIHLNLICNLISICETFNEIQLLSAHILHCCDTRGDQFSLSQILQSTIQTVNSLLEIRFQGKLNSEIQCGWSETHVEIEYIRQTFAGMIQRENFVLFALKSHHTGKSHKCISYTTKLIFFIYLFCSITIYTVLYENITPILIKVKHLSGKF